MARLRDPQGGCPWDLEQNFATIAPYTIEEAYEVADAIDRGDLDDLCDELGDLLLQVVFHARMAEEQGAFAFADVARAISDKMQRRHPHVFADVSVDDADGVMRNWEAIKRAERAAKGGDKEAAARKPVLAKLQAALSDGKSGRSVGLDEEEKALVRDLFLLTLKPVMYIANVLEDGFENNPHLDAVRAHAAAEGAQVVPVSAAIEEELSQLDDEDRDTFLADLGLSEPGLNRVINAAYSLLGLQTYFTAGVKEVRAWTVRRGLHPR
ncbi:hypothetical protein G6F50_014208 [Rhizopus delemar]|uniref:NTP pyrophosphohydrolase MazG-like domain-containing protein n=1 Tax=Rhizopus delemar TaxID=936053 RepID=A0A9P7C940_9FUNG|nr:hypothetical protein G6F50_014208 [Rhizopus delemar]